MKATSKPLRHLTPVLLALAVGGCSGLLHSNASAVQVYTLQPPSVVSGNGVGQAALAHSALRVAHPRPEAGLGTSQIVLLQSDHRLNVYAASGWAADAPVLLESLAVATLRGSGHWSSVQDSESPFPSDFLLQISVAHFDADYSDDMGVPPTVQVTLNCTLGTTEGRYIIATFVASGSAVASANRVGAVVAAFQQATDAALTSLSQQAAAAAAQPRG